MKQPQPLQTLPQHARSPAGSSRYRYFTSVPSTMVLRLGDLAASLPKGICSPDSDPGRLIEIPCAEIFRGPVPKLSLSYLAGLAPECFRSDAIDDAQIRLPVASLALSYRMIASRELIEPIVEPIIQAEPTAAEPIASEVINRDPSAQAAGEIESQNEVVAPEEFVNSDELPKPDLAQVDAQTSEQLTPAHPAENDESSPASGSRIAIRPINRRPFPILPIFRRREAEPEKPAPVKAVSRLEIPKPKGPRVPIVPPPEYSETFAPQVEEVDPVLDPEPSPSIQEDPQLAFQATPEEAVPEWNPSEALMIETEHLPKLGEDLPSEIPDQDALQAVFMTEELLGMDRVIELCGNLPGVKSCVLSQGSTILAAYNVPENIDLVSLSGHALEMLGTMRESASKMGIGAVPAVTVHSEKGPITFFNQEDICMLVLHKDRGFVPGVREKLQNVVEALSRANLPLPAAPGQSRLER